MTYTGPPRHDPNKAFRQSMGRASQSHRRYGSQVGDDAVAPFLVIRDLIKLVLWLPKTLYRMVRRK